MEHNNEELINENIESFPTQFYMYLLFILQNIIKQHQIHYILKSKRGDV